MNKSLHINLSEEKLKELKSHCALNGITMKDLLLELIEEYLKKNK
jgi:predicted DNA binding CopG/RHH family protein